MIKFFTDFGYYIILVNKFLSIDYTEMNEELFKKDIAATLPSGIHVDEIKYDVR